MATKGTDSNESKGSSHSELIFATFALLTSKIAQFREDFRLLFW